jgi:hypothetical protein
MTVLADGFLDRRVLLRSSNEQRFTLWPRASPSGLDESWTQELVYTDSHYCCPVNTAIQLGGLPLGRARSGTSIPVTIAPGVLVRPTVEQGARAAIDLVNAANEERVVFQHTTGPVSGSTIEIGLLSPDPKYLAQLVSDVDREGYFIGGRLQFFGDPVEAPEWETWRHSWWFVGEAGFFTAVIAHELGHAVGLEHHYADDSEYQGRHFGMLSLHEETGGGLEWAQYKTRRDFAPAEKLAMRLMHQRSWGNTFPDNDGGTRASATSGWTVGCRLAPPSSE